MSRVAHLLLGFALLSAPPATAFAQTPAPPAAVNTQNPAPPVPTEANAAHPTAPTLPAANDDDASTDTNLAERVLVSPREPRCEDNGQVGGINVCGKKRDNAKDRLPITSELNSATATADGLPRAPDMMGNRITGHSIKLGCLLGGCPKSMLPDIDFSLLPADPIGSDADRIGKGEIRGN